MGVDEARYDAGTLEVQTVDRVPFIQLLVKPDHASEEHADPAGMRAPRVHRDHICVLDEQVEPRFHAERLGLALLRDLWRMGQSRVISLVATTKAK